MFRGSVHYPYWNIMAKPDRHGVRGAKSAESSSEPAGRRLAPMWLEGDRGTLHSTRPHLRVRLPEPGIFKPPHSTHESKGLYLVKS